MSARHRGFAASLGLTIAAVLSMVRMRAADLPPGLLLLDAIAVGPDIVAVGERGTILRSTDAGQSWRSATLPASATLTAVNFAPDAHHGWAVGHDALILTTGDGGHVWQK